MKKIACLTTVVLLSQLLYSVPLALADEPLHEITSLSTTEITPGKTILTITGTGFGSPFNSENNQICFGIDDCRDASDLSEHLQAWSDTEATLLVPEDVTATPSTILLRVYFYDTQTFDYIESPWQYTIAEEPEPVDEGIVIYIGEGCPHCEYVQSHIAENNYQDFFTITYKETFYDQANAEEFTQVTIDFGLDPATKGVPTLVYGDQYIVGDTPIITYLDEQYELLYGEPEPEFVAPEITSFYPTELTPNDTIITIQGTSFGDYYIVGESQICFDIDGCISDTDINYYLISWSDTEIQVVAPPFVANPGKLSIVYKIPDTGEYWFTESPEQYTVKILPDPKITSFSPTNFTAGETVVTINGEGFGDSYEEGYNQICFGVDGCISDVNISDYLVSWNDTEIQVIPPPFVISDSNKISIKAYFPSKGYYDFTESASTYTVTDAPIIEWYYMEMDQGGEYVYSGQNFGNTKGKVILGNKECTVVSWSNTDVTFQVPLDASSGYIYIQNAKGLKSQELYVEVIQIKTYSNDEFSRYQWQMEKLNMEKAWDVTEGSDEVIVAVIDSGVDMTHEDLEHAIWTNPDEISGNGIDDDDNGYIDDTHGWDFVLNSNNTTPVSAHGTMVASLIAAKKDNSVGIAGIAPNVKIMPLNVANYDGTTISVDAAIFAIKYAVDNGADVINLSFGGYESNFYYEDILQYAYDNNVLVVAATGNDALNVNMYNFAPACVDLNNNITIGVSATNSSDLLAFFSNYGSVCTDVSAPGEYIATAAPADDGYYLIGDGTSFASPIVAGIAALIKSKNPTWNVEEIKYVLLNNSRNIDSENPYYAGQLGEGIPDAYAALKAPRPSVQYVYNPSADIEIEETDAEVDIDVPEPNPIDEEPTPIKDESIDEDKADKNTEQLPQINYTSPFTDTTGYVYEDAIAFVAHHGIVVGYDDGSYRPNSQINRAEFSKILIEAYVVAADIHGTNCFEDVQDDWFAPSVCTGKNIGVLSGYPNGTFKPGNPINTVEALKIILNIEDIILTPSPGDDWYAPYVAYALNTSLSFILYENAFDTPITRGQMAEMIYQTLTNF